MAQNPQLQRRVRAAFPPDNMQDPAVVGKLPVRVQPESQQNAHRRRIAGVRRLRQNMAVEHNLALQINAGIHRRLRRRAHLRRRSVRVSRRLHEQLAQPLQTNSVRLVRRPEAASRPPVKHMLRHVVNNVLILPFQIAFVIRRRIHQNVQRAKAVSVLFIPVKTGVPRPRAANIQRAAKMIQNRRPQRARPRRRVAQRRRHMMGDIEPVKSPVLRVDIRSERSPEC